MTSIAALDSLTVNENLCFVIQVWKLHAASSSYSTAGDQLSLADILDQ